MWGLQVGIIRLHHRHHLLFLCLYLRSVNCWSRRRVISGTDALILGRLDTRVALLQEVDRSACFTNDGVQSGTAFMNSLSDVGEIKEEPSGSP
ncbi:hypothetical protein V8D89_008441 [Ganoderma adspersum]